MIIGLTGTNGAGKGTVVEFLKKKGFVHYSARDLISEEIVRRGMSVTRESLISVGNQLRYLNTSSYIAEQLFEKALKQGGNAVIESLRTVGEIMALRRKGNFFLIAVDADAQLRYERVKQRNGPTDQVSFEQFMLDEQNEMFSADPTKQNLRNCIQLADVTILNNGNMEDLENDINLLLEHIGFKEQPLKEHPIATIQETKKEISTNISNTNVNNAKIAKREGYISWDDYFMGIALLSAKRSKDPGTQVGACIVTPENKIAGIGYNGFPIGCSDEKLPWAREGAPLETKYLYVCHAELNAILNSANTNLKGCRIYVPLFPCNECAKAIIQSGIKQILYLSDKYALTDAVKASKIMFDQAGVKYTQYAPKTDSLSLDFSAEKI